MSVDFNAENVKKQSLPDPDPNMTLSEKKSFLLDYMLRSESLNEFFDGLALLLGLPVLLMSPSYVMLAYSSVHEVTDIVWNHAIEKGYYPDYVIGYLVQHHRAWDISCPDRELFERSLPFSEYNRLLCNLWSKGELLGSILVLLSGKEPGEDDRKLIMFARDIAERLIGFNRKGSLEKGHPQDALLVGLLQGKNPDQDALYSQFLIDSMSNTGHYMLINIEFLPPGKPDDFSRSFDILFPKATIFVYNGRLLIFFAQPAPIDVSDSLLATFDGLLSKHNAVAYISDEFGNLFRLREHYRKNVQTGKLASAVKDERRVVFYDDYKFIDMYLLAASNIGILEAESFICRKAYEIYQYDIKHGTEYINTLWSYISAKESVIDAGKMMRVHRNTIVYRILRIKDLFQLDFSQIEKNFQLYYSCYILRFHEKMRGQGSVDWKELHRDYGGETL